MFQTLSLRLTLLLVLFTCFIQSSAQTFELKGVVYDSQNQPVSDVFIRVLPDSISLVSDFNGQFTFRVAQGKYDAVFSHINFETAKLTLDVQEDMVFNMILKVRSQVLQDVSVTDQAIFERNDISLNNISAKNAIDLTSATGDFNKILATLPGVVSNNELSSVFSVRGGNYDENLIYVNGMKVYRPQIISAGRQEGLSFINPDLVRSVNFSAGGWTARYGDKLSSVLDVSYAEPIDHEARVNLGLLGGSLYYGGVNKKGDFSVITGVRHKDTRYLLGTLETQGQYLPRFTDFQTYLTKRIGDRTKVGILLVGAQNRYRTVPVGRRTEFGTIQNSFRLTVGFDGRELLDYDTYQGGVILSHAFKDKITSHLSISGVYSAERENYEIEGGYLLCNLNNAPGSSRNQCVNQIGIGRNYSFGRNRLEASVVNLEQRNEIIIDNDLLEFGFSWDHELLDDRLMEFAFVDSADFSTVTAVRDSEVDLDSDKVAGFLQYTLASVDSAHVFNAGVRLNYWTYSKQLLVSPRLQYSFSFGPRDRNLLRASWGFYQQHPFYRELRNRDGVFNADVRAQSSMHFIAGWDRLMSIWGRLFKLSTDAYYKNLWSVNLYDVNNVKIRYFANNDAVAYAYGTDFRINGEFIPGTESWFSLGYLKTEEALTKNDNYVRRPMDQRVNVGIFFQDHFPNDPSIRVSLNLLYGTGLPFGPPDNDEFRNAFRGDEYARVDIGFSKTFAFNINNKFMPKSLWFGIDVLNLLGTDNAISYTWVQDVNANQFAVPNALSSRFFNLRAVAKF